MKRTLTIVTLFYIFIFSSYGQLSNRIHEQLTFKYLTIDEGLNNNRVRGLVQDNYGFIWIGSRKGINRFDGYELKSYARFYNDTANFELTETRGIFCDSKHTLWAVGIYGICYFNWAEDRFIQFSHEELNVDINNCGGLDEDKNGNIWFATNDGLLMYNQEKDEVKLYTQDENNPMAPGRGTMDKIIVSDQNYVWYSFTRDGVGYLDQETGVFTQFYSTDDPGSPGENRNERLYKDRRGDIWIGHNNNGLSKYSYATGKFMRYFPEPERIESGRVRGIIEDRQGNFWIGTQGGLYLFNKKDESFRRYAYADHPISTLSHNSIQTMIVDNQDGLWLGTFAGGVSYTNLNSSGIIKYEYSKIPSEYYLNDKNVYSLTFDHEGNIWVGTENGGLNFLNINTGKFTYFTHDPDNRNTPLSNNIKDIYVDEDGKVWFGTYKGGLSVYNPETGNFKHYQQSPEFPEGLSDETIFIVYPDVMDDNIIWVCATNRLYMFNKQEGFFTVILPETPGFTNTPTFNRIFSAIKAPDNKMVFGGNKLIILDRNTNNFTVYPTINGNSISQIDFVVLDKYNFLWAGINTSYIVRFDMENEEFIVFDTTRGLPEMDYLEGAPDENGNLWLSTNQGIWKLEKIIENQDSFKIVHYDNSDNVQSLEFLYHSKAMSPDGEILFGGINGFNSFYPEKVKPNPYLPNVIITKLTAVGKEVKVGEKVMGKVLLEKPIMETTGLRFNHKIKIFTFHFTAFHFVAPENNKFKYILEGYDDGWQYTDANIRSATYSNIPRGDYIFKVDATNNNGKWSGKPFSIKVKIIPPFWKTIWFYSIIAIILGFLVFLFVKWRERQLKHDKEILEDKLKKGQEQIDKSKHEIEKQRLALEEKERQEREMKWYNEGLAQFADLLREDKDDLKQLTQKLIKKIIKYIEVEQGAIFLEQKGEETESRLELFAHYAINGEILKEKSIVTGEGQIGACFKSREVIQLDNLPDDYCKLCSGLGETKLPNLLLLPIMHDENIVGVIEMASFKKVEAYKIGFLQKINESIVSVVTSAKASQVIKDILEKSQMQTEQLRSQEEEMRQNMEEMKATQEEADRREKQWQEEAEKYRKLSEQLKKELHKKDR
ncbi:MAG: GAF domain-containing protein [Bacteroidales bacterium]|nr:GAF domain-containing protein [Bacteroidales bacterium]